MRKENIDMKKNQVELLELKNNNSQIKISLNELNGRLDKGEEKSLDLEILQQELSKLKEKFVLKEW